LSSTRRRSAPDDHLSADAGRNFDEILRVIDSLQLTDAYSVSTPVNWEAGQDVIIVPSVSDFDAERRFPLGWRAAKPYLRLTPDPRSTPRKSISTLQVEIGRASQPCQLLSIFLGCPSSTLLRSESIRWLQGKFGVECDHCCRCESTRSASEPNSAGDTDGSFPSRAPASIESECGHIRVELRRLNPEELSSGQEGIRETDGIAHCSISRTMAIAGWWPHLDPGVQSAHCATGGPHFARCGTCVTEGSDFPCGPRDMQKHALCNATTVASRQTACASTMLNG